MKKLTSNEIRTIWLKFFQEKQHYLLPSDSLIPANDDSILWINSGVATLKSFFDGSEKPPAKRLTNSQKAIRTGDIENVGITTRHHTFFEMLGNFSIGDYFKKDAIKYAWELLTSDKWLEIDKNLLYVTVFEEDEDAIKQWESVGVESTRIFKMGRDTNFWDIGKGPCGPSTEIFFDKGINYDSRSARELIQKDLENDRYVEIWNIVFSQFNNDGEGNYTELPQKNIDTGAGLERVTSALQGKPSNFETDLFEKIIKLIESNSSEKYLYEYIPSKLKEENLTQFYINSWYKKIADYIRSVSFAISDGALPESTGRGYILRMLIRKAVINKIKLGIEDEFLNKLVDPIVELMGEFYPNLVDKSELIKKVISEEEIKFNKNLNSVTKKMNEHLDKGTLNEENAYKLHETFGMPLEFIKDISIKDERINLDWEKINQIDKDFRNKSRGNKNVDAMHIQDDLFRGLGETKFIGYDKNESISKVVFVKDDKVVFDKTPFYATSGGQESDFGKANGLNVEYVEKNAEKTFIHKIPNNKFKVGDEVNLKIDLDRREGLTIHHSATHLLFSGLEVVTDQKIPQQGSKVEENFLRFDFAYQGKIDTEILNSVQNKVNEWIKDSTNVEIFETTLENAKSMGAAYLEGTKYSNDVRVVKMNELVIDMCGGTHVKNTSDIEKVLITKFEKRGSGIWRLEAVAGNENIAEATRKINLKKIEDDINPQQNKIELTNLKYTELNMNKKLDFSVDVKNLDINKNLDNEIQELVEKIKTSLVKSGNEISIELQSKIEILMDNKIAVYKTEVMNIQEITRIFLNKIDESKNTKLAIALAINDEKITVGFIIPTDKIDSDIVTQIKKIAEEFDLRGNGKKQQYIFGGKKFDVELLVEKVKQWQF